MTQDKTNKVSNVPPLRFPEFSGEWEKFALSDFTERVTRRNKGNACRLPLTISAQYGLVDQITFFNKQIASADMSNYYLMKKGEFTYNKSYSGDYPWGAVKRLDRYDEGCLSSLYICFSLKPFVNSDFITHYFETTKWYRGVSEIAGEGARNHGLLNIAIPDYFATKHYLPANSEEQQKNADLFNLLTKRIETQIRVIDKLESLIKGIYNSILWREYKQASLSDIFIERNERTTSNNQYEVLSSTAKGLFRQADYFDKEVASANNVGYKVLRLGDVVLSPQNLWLGNINYNDIFEIGIVSPSYKVFSIRKQFNPYYVSCFLKTHRALYEYANASEQGASVVRRNLDLDAFMAITFPMPDKDIQDSVSKKLQAINKKLSVEKQILDKLKEQKNYLLSQMFI